MTGPEHYREAERLLEGTSERAIARAQVHATLALAAATALGHWDAASQSMSQPDRQAWEKAASERPATIARQREADRAEAEEFSYDVTR